MERKFRLTKSKDFKRVRRNGKSYAHPLIVLIVLPQDEEGHSQFGIQAGRAVGKAVRRNRAKRMLREALRSLLPEIDPGWEVLLLSRHSLPDASLTEIRSALTQLLSRAGILKETNGTRFSPRS